MHPVSASLPQQVIQNDANDHNIVVDATGDKVAGIIDFGDMVRTSRVNELAICIAYGAQNRGLWSTGRRDARVTNEKREKSAMIRHVWEGHRRFACPLTSRNRALDNS